MSSSGSPAQSLTYALRRAENRGHIEKVRSASDRRSYTVSLTPSAVALHQRAAEAADATLLAVEADLQGGAGPVRAALHDLRAALERVAPAPSQALQH